MKIMMAQMRVKSGDFDANYNAIEKIVEQAKNSGSELLVLPEMCIAGYFVGDEWERETFIRDAELIGKAVSRLSTGKLHIIFGNVGIDWNSRGEDGRVRKYNASFHAHKGNFVNNEAINLNFWPKVLLPNYREFDDSRHFYDLRKLAVEKNRSISSMVSPIILQDCNNICWTIGVGICEDAWSTDYNFSLFDVLASMYPIDFFLSINGSPYTMGKIKKREKVFGSLASRTKKPILHTNCVGMQNVGKTLYGFDGSCGLVGRAGEIEFTGDFFEAKQYVFDAFKQDNQAHIKSLIPTEKFVTNSRSAELCAALESILAYTLQEWQIQRVVIGASGGIDSALAATLFSRILGPNNVFLINMPSRFNSSLTQNAAKQLALNLGCPYGIMSIENAVNSTKNDLLNLNFINSEVRLEPSSFVCENIQARDRGARILASIAASLQAVFSCNANKAETTIGYATLYGDLAGFLAPLADLWKHDIYELAHHYNLHIYKREIIPREIFEVRPSAELSEAHDVTKGKGDPLIYEYHDYLFKAWVESWRRCDIYDILFAYSQNKLEELIGCELGLVKKIFRSTEIFIADLERWWLLYQGMGAVKRVQSPPIIALTQRAFGFDHRETIKPVRFGIAYQSLKEELVKYK